MPLRPGDEIVLPNYDLSKTGSRVSIDARWEQPDKVPNGYVGEITVRLANFDVPNQVFPVFAGEVARQVALDEVPRLSSVSAFRHVYRGLSTTLIADNKAQALSWTATWAKNPSIQQTGKGPVFTFSGDALGDWVVELTSASPEPTLIWRRTIHVTPPPLPKPNIIRTLVQDSVRLLGTPRPGDHQGLHAEWILPNGKTTDKNPLAHVFGESEYGLYTYRIWYGENPDRYRESTIMINNRDTKWPKWTLSKKVLAKHWPIEVDYRITPSRIDYVKNNMEHLSFQYLIPPDASISFRHMNRATVNFGEGGAYPIVVRISDDRGHVTELHDEVVLDELPTLAGALDIFSKDPWYRVPLTVNVTPVIKESFEGEFATNFRYYLDGKLLHEGVDSHYIMHDVTEPGVHRVRVDLTTNYGRRLSLNDVFTATSTEPPACNIRLLLNANLHLWEVETDCEENEGSITELRWRLSLKEAPNDYITFFAHRRRATVPHWASRRGIKDIRLEATNDKNHVSRTVMDFTASKEKILKALNR